MAATSTVCSTSGEHPFYTLNRRDALVSDVIHFFSLEDGSVCARMSEHRFEVIVPESLPGKSYNRLKTLAQKVKWLCSNVLFIAQVDQNALKFVSIPMSCFSWTCGPARIEKTNPTILDPELIKKPLHDGKQIHVVNHVYDGSCSPPADIKIAIDDGFPKIAAMDHSIVPVKGFWELSAVCEIANGALITAVNFQSRYIGVHVPAILAIFSRDGKKLTCWRKFDFDKCTIYQIYECEDGSLDVVLSWSDQVEIHSIYPTFEKPTESPTSDSSA